MKYEKGNIGIKILDGILAKYFKDTIPQDFKEKLEKQLNLADNENNENKDSSNEEVVKKNIYF